MTVRAGLPSDALGLKVMSPDGTWTPVTGNESITNLVTNPSFEYVEPGTAVMRENLATNPSLELNSENWNIRWYGPSASGTTTRTSHQGKMSYLKTYTNPSASPQDTGISYTVPVIAGKTYSISMLFNSNVPQMVALYGQWWNGSTKIGDTFSSDVRPIVPNSWAEHNRYIVEDIVAPTGATSLLMISYPVNPIQGSFSWQPNDWIANTEVMITASTSISNYFDGNSVDQLGWVYDWSGTAGASTSVAKAAAVELRKNLIPNPSFEVNTNTWGPNTGNFTLVRDTALFRSKTASAKVVCVSNSSGDINTYSHRALVTVGSKYTASAYVYSPGGASTVRITLDFRNSSGGILTPSYSPYTETQVPGSIWTRVSITGTAPAGSEFCFVRVGYGFVVPVGWTYYVDDVLVERSDSVMPYFDGSSSSESDFIYSWSGADHSSISVQKATFAKGWGYNNTIRKSWHSTEWTATGNGKSVAVLSMTPNIDSFAEGRVAVGETLGGRTFTLLGVRRTTEDLPALRDGRAWSMNWAYYTSEGVRATSTPIGPTTAGIHIVRHTITFDENVEGSSFFRVYNGSSTPGNIVWWDDIVVVEGEYTGPYFSGYTVPDTNYIYRWTGEPHNSTSIGT